MKIVAFGHRRRVGKDLASSLLKSKLFAKTMLTVEKEAFADAMYGICEELYGWAGMRSKFYYDEVNSDAKEVVLPEIGKSPRQILIDFGSLAVRDHVYKDTWVDYVLKKKRLIDVLIISDLRFSNEFDKIKELGGMCIKIDRDVPQSQDVADAALSEETRWDVVIKNDSTAEALSNKVWSATKEYLCVD